ncbi:MAG: DNA primase [Bacteroidota bacterium]
MRIPPEKIDEVRLSSDIVTIIGGFVALKKRGKNFLGLCPFHQEKTPSFTVSAEKQMYHCFGCGKGGNVFTFLMETEKISFIEAVKTLAEKAGILLPTYQSEQGDKPNLQEELYNVCRQAGLMFHQNLYETVEGKLALEYFKHRGFSDETIKTFGLGYSMNGWDTLVRTMEAQQIPMERLEQAGLARKRDDGSYYDYFRGRAMFPIFSRTGRAVGFGARKILEDDMIAGKYINSPETPIYSKSRSLYGLFQSKEAIRDAEYAILVEGYADLISMYQAGIQNIVASSGTALTKEQIKLVGDYAKKIVVTYDADSAGSKAALRGVDLIIEEGLEVRVAELPEGHDPDSYVREKGAKTFQSLIDSSISFIDYVAETYEHQGKLETPEGQAETVRALVQIIAKINDELKRDFYIKQIADKYKITEPTLHREMKKNLSQSGLKGYSQTTHSSPDRQIVPVAINHTAGVPSEIPSGERDLIHSMFDGGLEVVRMAYDLVNPIEFTHPQSRQMAEILFHQLMEGIPIDPSSLINQIEDEKLRNAIAAIVFSRYQLSRQTDTERFKDIDPKILAHAAIIFLKIDHIGKAIVETRKKMREAAIHGEDSIPFIKEMKKLEAELRGLKHGKIVLSSDASS